MNLVAEVFGKGGNAVANLLCFEGWCHGVYFTGISSIKGMQAHFFPLEFKMYILL